MKDSFVLGACCWATYNFFKIFIARKKILINIFFLIINFALLINIKSYVAISLLPGFILWLYSNYLKQIRNKIIKVAIAPFLILIIDIYLHSILNLQINRILLSMFILYYFLLCKYNIEREFWYFYIIYKMKNYNINWRAIRMWLLYRFWRTQYICSDVCQSNRQF